MSRSIDRRPLKLHFGLGTPIPGFLAGMGWGQNEGSVAEIFCRDLDCILVATPEDPFFKACLKILEPGGRFEATLFDFEKTCAEFHKAVQDNNDARKDEVSMRMAGRVVCWETRLRVILGRAGFERTERLPGPELRMIAFKPDGKAEAK